MNLLNRIFVLLLLLAIGVLSMSVVVLAWTLPNETIDFLRDGADWLEEHNHDTEKAILTFIGVAITLLVFIFLIFELLPRRSRDVRIEDVNAGEAVISASALARRLEERVQDVDHVSGVTASVKTQRKGVEVAMDLHVDADANLAEVSDAASAMARDTLTNRMHVALSRPPQIRLHYRELRLQNGKKAAAPAETAAEEKPSEPVPPATDDAAWRPAAPAGSVVATEPEPEAEPGPDTAAEAEPVSEAEIVAAAEPVIEPSEAPVSDKPAGEDVPDPEKKTE